MRRCAQQRFALAQGLMHQAKLAVFEITQAPVDELGGSRGRAGREVVLLDQNRAQTAAGGVPRNSGTIDTAANNSQVKISHCASHIGE
jgi:hypothetical protein